MTAIERLEDLLLLSSGTNESIVDEMLGPLELHPDLLYGSDEDWEVVPSKYGSINNCMEFGSDDVFDNPKIGTKIYDESMISPATDEGDRDKKVLKSRRKDDFSKEMMERECMKECTFKPKIGRAPRKYDIGVSEGIPVFDRLTMQQHKKRDEDVRRWQEEDEKAYREHCTFAPALFEDDVKKNLGSFHRIPLQDRISLEWRRKEANLSEATKRADIDITFKPKLNPLSETLAERRRQRRLHEGIQQKVKRKDCLQSNLTECDKTFMCDQSQRILKQNAKIPTNFHLRQEYFADTYARNRRRKEDNQMCSKQKSFGSIPPHLLLASERLVNQMLETNDERIHRMAHREMEERELRREKRRQELDDEFSFHPKLNTRSLKMPTVQGGDTWISQRLKEYKEEQYRECTFKPDTSKPTVHGFYTEYRAPSNTNCITISTALRKGTISMLMEQAKQKIAQKALKKEILDRERIAQEMEECTFTPKLNDKRLSIYDVNESIENLPGMKSYFERLRMIEGQREHARRREQEVFVQPDNWTGCPTIPKPFDLSFLKCKDK